MAMTPAAFHEILPGPLVGGREVFQACSESSSGDTGESEGAGEGGGGTKLESGSPCVKDSRHMLSKNRAASRRDSPLLRFSMGPREPLAGDLSTQVAPTPEGSRNVLTNCWGLASGDSRNLRAQRCVRGTVSQPLFSPVLQPQPMASPVLPAFLISIGDEVAAGLGVVVVLRR